MLRPHISEKEGLCDCGCKLQPSDKFLDLVERFRMACGFPMPFTSMARCRSHNDAVKGVKDSPHLLVSDGYGACDVGISDPWRRNVMMKIGLALGFNHIEVCDRHMHFASVPSSHRLYGQLNWGKSK